MVMQMMNLIFHLNYYKVIDNFQLANNQFCDIKFSTAKISKIIQLVESVGRKVLKYQ